MADLLKVEDLEKAKKHDTFHSEVITGKDGGLSGGDDIDYATNAVTGQVQKTLPKTIDDLDWTPVGTFAAGVTFTKSTDYAIDGDGAQWIYTGQSPFPVVVAPGTVPSSPDYKIIYSSDYGELPNGRVNQHRRGTSAEIAAYVLADGEVIKNDDDGTLHVGDGVTAGGTSIANKRNTVLSFDTLNDAIASVTIKEGYSINIKERSTGNGGGALWDVVLASTVTPNTYNIVQCTGVPTLALVLRVGMIIEPEQFGVTGDGALSQAAWAALVTYLKDSNGGYVLGNPSAIYMLSDETTSADTTLYDLGAVNGVTFDFNGATLKSTTVQAQGTINWFKSQNGKNITFKNGVLDTTLLVNGSADPIGVQFFLGHDKCQNVKVKNFTGPGGVGGLVAFERSNTGEYLEFSEQARGIEVENIDLDAVGYVGNFRFNGSHATGRGIKVGYAHRVWFPYGVTDHDVDFEVDDFDAVGARIWCLNGRTTQNIHIKAKTLGIYPTPRPAASLVQLVFDNTLASFAKNITVDILSQANLNLGKGFEIVLDGAVAAGMHSIDGLTLKGEASNHTGAGVRYALNGGATIADHLQVDGLDVDGLKMRNNGSESLLPISNSDSNHYVRRIDVSGGNDNFSLQYGGTTYTKKVFFEKCVTTGRLYAFPGVRSHFGNCDIGDSTNQNYNVSTYDNTNISGIGVINKPDLRYVVTDKGGASQQYAVGYKYVSGSTSSTIALELTKGTDIYPQHLPSESSGFVAGNVYSFCIGCASGTDIGAFSGRVLLQSDGADITAAILSDVSVVQTLGSGFDVGHLTVSLNYGSPVFTLDSGGANIYNVAEIVIREI